jgi:hypothetical protein
MLNLNYNINASNLERAKFTEQENEAFRPFQIQYIIVPAGGGAAGGNNSFNSGSDIPKVGIAGNGGVISTGSYCVQPFITYPIVVGKGGAGGIATSQSSAWTGSDGGNSAFFNVEAIGGNGGKSQVYITSSTFAGNGLLTSASGANGGTGSQWTYNLPGCLPTPFDPTCHGGDLISSSYYSGGGAGIVVSGSINTLTIEYAIIAGGGGGSTFQQNPPNANSGAGGGGAGGMVTGSFKLEPIVKTYPIIVGAGGLKGTLVGVGAEIQNGQNGSGSSAFGVSTTGGEGGIAALDGNGVRGGNSGTGSWGNTTQYLGANGLAAGGAGVTNSGSIGTDGPTAPERSGGSGGNGLQWVNGTYYAGGGGGAFSRGSDVYVGTDGLGANNFGGGGEGSRGNSNNNGVSGSVMIRYFGTGSRLSGATAVYNGDDGYTYYTFTASANLVYDQEPSQIFTSGLPGIGSGNSLFSISGSTSPIANTGGGAAATYYNQNGVSGSDGFVAIRYEGAPIAQGGNVIVTDYYTYHLFSSSADFYVIGNETNPNINPCE